MAWNSGFGNTSAFTGISTDAFAPFPQNNSNGVVGNAFALDPAAMAAFQPSWSSNFTTGQAPAGSYGPSNPNPRNQMNQNFNSGMLSYSDMNDAALGANTTQTSFQHWPTTPFQTSVATSEVDAAFGALDWKSPKPVLNTAHSTDTHTPLKPNTEVVKTETPTHAASSKTESIPAKPAASFDWSKQGALLKDAFLVSGGTPTAPQDQSIKPVSPQNDDDWSGFEISKSETHNDEWAQFGGTTTATSQPKVEPSQSKLEANNSFGTASSTSNFAPTPTLSATTVEQIVVAPIVTQAEKAPFLQTFPANAFAVPTHTASNVSQSTSSPINSVAPTPNTSSLEAQLANFGFGSTLSDGNASGFDAQLMSSFNMGDAFSSNNSFDMSGNGTSVPHSEAFISTEPVSQFVPSQIPLQQHVPSITLAPTQDTTEISQASNPQVAKSTESASEFTEWTSGTESSVDAFPFPSSEAVTQSKPTSTTTTAVPQNDFFTSLTPTSNTNGSATPSFGVFDFGSLSLGPSPFLLPNDPPSTSPAASIDLKAHPQQAWPTISLLNDSQNSSVVIAAVPQPAIDPTSPVAHSALDQGSSVSVESPDWSNAPSIPELKQQVVQILGIEKSSPFMWIFDNFSKSINLTFPERHALATGLLNDAKSNKVIWTSSTRVTQWHSILNSLNDELTKAVSYFVTVQLQADMNDGDILTPFFKETKVINFLKSLGKVRLVASRISNAINGVGTPRTTCKYIKPSVVKSLTQTLDTIASSWSKLLELVTELECNVDIQPPPSKLLELPSPVPHAPLDYKCFVCYRGFDENEPSAQWSNLLYHSSCANYWIARVASKPPSM